MLVDSSGLKYINLYGSHTVLKQEIFKGGSDIHVWFPEKLELGSE